MAMIVNFSAAPQHKQSVLHNARSSAPGKLRAPFDLRPCVKSGKSMGFANEYILPFTCTKKLRLSKYGHKKVVSLKGKASCDEGCQQQQPHMN